MIKVCPVCQRPFLANTLKQKYCSPACAYAVNKQRARLRLKKSTLEAKACPVCGKVFEPKSDTQIYCSPQCYKEAKKVPADIVFEDASGTYIFKDLLRAAKFLAFHTQLDAQDCLAMLNLHKAQIGNFKVSYGG